MKALVIDDSRAMRTILGQVLKGAGFEVAEAGHGREGLERLQAGARPDVVLVDWNMPEMNGLEFVRALRGRRDCDGVRLMMVTTETEAARVAEALAQGADAYVTKPFTREAILEKLADLGVVGAG